MGDDYLWDGSGTPDPDLERLERLLRPLRSTAPAPQIGTAASPTGVDRTPVRWLTARFLVPALTAAAAVTLMVASTRYAPESPASWQVASTSGAPRIGSRVVGADGRLAVGQTLTTDAASSARIEVTSIGEVLVGSNTRVRLIETGSTHHRLALDRGSLRAIVVAPPGQFVVDTPSATATDLGCIYTLHVDEDGSGLLSVEVGWVAFEDKGRESFVPAGASSRMDPASGPGTPSYDDAEAAVHEALEVVDADRDTGRRRAALRLVLERARARDAMTLWHLIPRVAEADRPAVVDALAARVAMPSTVTRDGVLRLDRAALDQWWDALGLLDANWWRKWKGPLPAVR